MKTTYCNCWIYSIFKVNKMKSILFVFILMLCTFSKLTDAREVVEMTTFSPPTTDRHYHIISFVEQKRNKQEFVEPSLKAISNKSHVMVKFFDRIVQKLDPAANVEPIETDDLLLDEPNTLINTAEPWEDNNKSNEVRRSIPVLEPVRHLLNTVRDGGFNHTISQTTVSKNPHHHLFVPNAGMENESSAIETEEEREMVNESTELQFLDFAGRFGAKIWGFFTNLQRIFAASSGQ